MNTAFDSVSFDSESLILVDPMDNPVGTATKVMAHADQGQLHRAFSIFLFSQTGHVLLQKRSSVKPLWPNFWSNACCSHPRQGESYDQATQRRLREELGLTLPLYRLFQFEYHALFEDVGAEHELCSVYAGVTEQPCNITPHPEEVAAWDWYPCETVDQWCIDRPEQLTPWFLLEWKAIRSEHRTKLTSLLTAA